MGKKVKGNGEGTIYKSSKRGLYVGQYTINYKRHSVYQKKNEKIGDFKKRFNNILSSINTGTYIEKSNETFIGILKRHVEQKHKDGITSDSGYLRELYIVASIEKSCSNFINKKIQKITIDDIEDCKESLREYSQTSIDKAWTFIKKTFKLAISRRLIIYNPMDDETLLKPISKKETKVIDALTIEEEENLNKILDNEERKHKYRNISKLQLLTGMRIGEVLARSRKDVDFKNMTLNINSTITRDSSGKTVLGRHTKTYNKRTNVDKGQRYFPINSEIKNILKEELKKKVTNIYDLLFWDYKNNTFVSYQEINSWLARLNDKYHISAKPLTSHVLRHTFITRLREKGVDMKVIQYLVGHTNNSKITDEVYTSLSDNFISKELEKIK